MVPNDMSKEAKPLIPRLLKVQKKSAQTITQETHSLALSPTNIKRKVIGNINKAKNDSFEPKISVASLNASSGEEYMFKYHRLAELVTGGKVHSCHICHFEFSNTIEEIQRHVSTEHDINALQYHAIYFNRKYWQHVSKDAKYVYVFKGPA